MKFISLQSSDFGLSRENIASTFAPFVCKHVQHADSEWRTLIADRKKKILRKYLVKRLIGWLPHHQRNEEFIINEYSDVWIGTEYKNYSLDIAPPRYSPWEWNGQNMLASAFGGIRVRQLLLAKAIEHIKPATVLEVGCGNGINLLMLSGLFPEVEFTGVELTEEGYNAAIGFQQKSRFPEEMESFVVMPIKDQSAFKRVNFTRGSAADLKFKDHSFDLVYTVLALEQMERIRNQALSEIARVASGHTLMIEPFYDVNKAGWERANVVRRNYFCGRIDDLPKYNLHPVQAINDFPQELFLKACAVLSEKKS
jgi:SAM-dependent methyltransferase